MRANTIAERLHMSLLTRASWSRPCSKCGFTTEKCAAYIFTSDVWSLIISNGPLGYFDILHKTRIVPDTRQDRAKKLSFAYTNSNPKVC